MHLYRSLPKGQEYIFPTQSFSLSNSDNGSLIRINTTLTITIPLNLKSDFYCQIKVFYGVQCRVEFEAGVNVAAVEGFLIEGGQTFTVFGNGLADGNASFDIIRDRPVLVDNFYKLLSSSKNPIPDTLRINGNTEWRIMEGGALVYESTVLRDRLRNDVTDTSGYENPDAKLYTLYSKSNKLATSSTLHGVINHVENMDFTSCTVLTLQGEVSLITPVCNKPDMKVNLSAGVPADQVYSIIKNYNGYFLNCITNLLTMASVIDMDNNPNVQKFEAINFGGTNFALNISNMASLNRLINVNANAFGVSQFTLTNCPLLGHIDVRNTSEGTQPNKNIDQVFIDLDTNGILNGTAYFSTDFVTTASSDAARASLVAKGWVIKRNYQGTTIE